MSLTLIASPAIEPVSVADLAARLRLAPDDMPDHLAQLIRSARERVERETGRALLSQTWMERRDSWDGDGRLLAFGTQFRLLRPPLIALEAITIYAQDGTPSDQDPAAFFVDTQADPGRIALKPDSVFPVPGREQAGIEIRFRCGYGDQVADIPAPLVEAVAQLAMHLHEADRELNRDAGLPLAVQSLIAPWRRRSL